MAHFRKGMLMIAALLFGVSLFIPCPVVAQEAKPKPEQCDFKTVDGKVIALDWVANMLIVDTGMDELSLVISRDTVFKKVTAAIIFAEVNQSDNVSVKYYDCGFAGLKAVAVNVTNGY